MLSEVSEIVISGELRPLNVRQFGFPSRSPTSGSRSVLSYSRSVALDKQRETRLFLRGVYKFFNWICNGYLLLRLSSFTYHLALLSWMSHLPSKRTISVFFHGILFQPFYVNASVPQGSTLVTTLCILIISRFFYISPTSISPTRYRILIPILNASAWSRVGVSGSEPATRHARPSEYSQMACVS